MMVLMENPGRVLQLVDGDAPERLWVEVRQFGFVSQKVVLVSHGRNERGGRETGVRASPGWVQ